MSERSRMPAKRTEDCGVDVRVLIVAVDVSDVLPSMSVEAKREQLA